MNRKQLIFLILTHFIFSCDNQQVSRLPLKIEDTGKIASDGAESDPGDENSKYGSGYEHCPVATSWPSVKQTVIGLIYICKNLTQDQVVVNFKTTDLTQNVCLFPMTNYSNGNSEYIGAPVCINQLSNQLQKINFMKNRQGNNVNGIAFNQLPLNSTLIVKNIQGAVAASINCMNASNKMITVPGLNSPISEKDYLCNEVLKKNYYSTYLSLPL